MPFNAPTTKTKAKGRTIVPQSSHATKSYRRELEYIYMQPHIKTCTDAATATQKKTNEYTRMRAHTRDALSRH